MENLRIKISKVKALVMADRHYHKLVEDGNDLEYEFSYEDEWDEEIKAVMKEHAKLEDEAWQKLQEAENNFSNEIITRNPELREYYKKIYCEVNQEYCVVFGRREPGNGSEIICNLSLEKIGL